MLKLNILSFVDPNQKNTILEIGSHEGASACFLVDNLLNHEESTLTCVDPFDVNDSTSPVTNETFILFESNILKSKWPSKVKLEKMYSSDFFKNVDQQYNLIYIDGSHLLPDITIDFENSLRLVAPGGIIWMDDYLGGGNYDIKNHIDSLFRANEDKLEIIIQGYQIAFRRK